MSWQAQLKEATFGGVPFKVDTADLAFGRDVQTEEAQGGSVKVRDIDPEKLTAAQLEAYNKFKGGQLGSNSWITKNVPLPRIFSVVAHFSGLNYIAERDAFINIVEAGDPKELVLPSFDPIPAYAGKAVVRYNNREGGFETIQVTFTQDQKTIQPRTRANTLGEALDAADAADLNFIASFATKVAAGAEWVATESTQLTEKISTTINDTLGLGAVGDALESVTEASESLAQNASTLIFTPTVLANQIVDTISGLTLAFEQPINAFNAQLQLLENYGIDLPSLGTASTPTEQDAIDNRNQFLQIVQNAAVTEAGRAAVLTEYTSLNEAQRAKSRFEAAARAVQLRNGDLDGFEQNYRALASVIAAVSNHITAQNNLPSNVDYVFPSEQPSLTLAEDLYGDPDRATDLVDRNSVRNPLFMDKELTVLSF